MKTDPRLIIEFCAVAEEASFTRAAERLRMAQPWLSTRLRRLEAALGFALFERDTRRVALTEKGARLFDAARALAAASERFDALAHQLRAGNPPRLRIGAPPYTKSLPERRAMINRFVTTNPDTQFELQTGWSVGLQDRLCKGELDLALCVGEYDRERCEGLLLRELGLCLTVARDHEFAAQDEIPIRHLHGRLLHVFTRSLNPALWDQFHAPLIEVGTRLVERPDVAEGGIEQMAADDAPTAFLDVSSDDLSASTKIVRVRGDVRAPLYLLRKRGDMNDAVASFWTIGYEICSARLGIDPSK